MRSLYLLPLVVIACGDNKGLPVRPDGPPRPDAPVDGPTVIPCGHTEMADASNDDLFALPKGTPEMTAISFGSQPVAVCGKINGGHYNTTRGVIDVDSYRFTVPAHTRGILYLTAPGAEALGTTLVEIYSLTSGASETGEFVQAFAATAADLPAGDYLITVSAYDIADIAFPIDYRLTLMLDSASRCAKSTATPFYAEAMDGVTASGNDVYEVRRGGTPARKLTDVVDAPEPTGLTVNMGASYRVTGISSLPASAPLSWMDSYQDRDTYQIVMGANTNVLSVRLNWPATTADLDVLVFQAGDVIEQATGWYNRNMEDEFVTLAAIPGAVYWVFVGADDATTGQPIDYDLTFCGHTFSP